jgi:hypothetical protein
MLFLSLWGESGAETHIATHPQIHYTFGVEYPFPPVGIVGAADGKNRRAFLCVFGAGGFRRIWEFMSQGALWQRLKVPGLRLQSPHPTVSTVQSKRRLLYRRRKSPALLA